MFFLLQVCLFLGCGPNSNQHVMAPRWSEAVAFKLSTQSTKILKAREPFPASCYLFPALVSLLKSLVNPLLLERTLSSKSWCCFLQNVSKARQASIVEILSTVDVSECVVEDGRGVMTSPVLRMAWGLAGLLCLAPSLTAPTRDIRIGAIFTEDQKVRI